MLRTLTRKLLLAGGVLLLCAAIATTVIIITILNIHSAVDHLTDHTIERVRLSGEFDTDIFRSIVEVESFVRNPNPADRAEALTELHNARAILDQLAVETTAFDASDAASDVALTELQQPRVAIFNVVEPAVLHIFQAAAANDTTAIARSLADLNAIEPSIKTIEERSSDVAEQSIHAATATITRVMQQAIVTTVGLFGLIALAVLGLLLFIRQTIVRPVTQLSVVTRTVSEGDLDHTILVTSVGEIGDLQVAFNQMITNLRAAGVTVAEQQLVLEARVAERERAEGELRTQKELLQTIFDHIPVMISFLGADGRPQMVNRAYERTLGWSFQELQHPNLDLFAEICPEPQERQRVLQFIAAATGEWVDSKMSVRDGRVLDASWASIRLADGTSIGIGQDITARKQVEAELSEERALLTQRVAERTAELSAANADLARAARQKDEFLASMSHELRTPLNTILGMAETVQEGIFGPITDEQTDALQHIEESGRHLLELINDILDLSKIEADKFDLELEEIALAPICQASVRLVKQTATHKRLTIDMNLDPMVGMLQGDARRVKQMLVNLLSNAIKFTPEGGTIGLDVVGDAAAQQVHVTVWDTGIGIAGDDLPRLFQPFVQLDSRLARQYNGTGLGLALVQRMAVLHGGSVAVESTLGQGSRFTITLPWIATVPQFNLVGTVESAAPAAMESSAMQRALVIDDSPPAAAHLARYLRDLGTEVYVHVCGAGALELALDICPDVILLDIQLPDIAGWEVLAQLKADPHLRSIPIVIVSVVDDRPRGMALGATAYLVKPITRQQLQETLHTIQTGHAVQTVQTVLVTAPVILLAEDDENNVRTLSPYLAAKGYQVVVARNGAEVLERVHATPPALILMDIQMPGMDGLEAIRRIRATPRLAAIPIIALTALAMEGDRERCLAAGADDYLSKPVSLRGLVATIDVHLHHQAPVLESINDTP